MGLNIADLNKLKCFQAVAEKGSLLEGAKSIHLTPSAVYQSIKKLEGDLEKHLFFRSGKKYVLTEEGRNLQELFQKFLWDLSTFQEKSIQGESLQGEIRVGLPLNFSKSFFIPILKKFNQEFPRVSFHLTTAETALLIDDVTSFNLDFAITDDAIPPEAFSKIVSLEVFREELVMICDKDFHKLHEKDLKDLKLMKDLPHLDYARHQPLLQRWYKLHYKKQVSIPHFHSIDNVETMLAAIKAGLGLGIVPRDLTSGQMKDLFIVESKVRALSNTLYFVQEANYINNNLMKRFIQFMKDELKARV
jgi:DNA-binding transcriptional LysR family regulator